VTPGALAAAAAVTVAVLATGRRVPPGESVSQTGRTRGPVTRAPWPAALLLGGAALLGLALRVQAGPIGLGGVAGAVLVVAAERRRSRRRAQRHSTAARVEEALAVLCAELGAGRSPPEALAGAAEVAPDLLAEAVRVLRLGGSPAPLLDEAAQRHGAGALRQLRAAWLLVETTGAPAADVLNRVSIGVRAELAAAREVDEQLSPVRATARVLAILPVAGMGLGVLLGVNVPAMLLTTGWGQVCLAVAVALVAAGLTVVDRIAERAVEPR